MTVPARALAGWRRFVHLKLRFGLSKLPLCPARYRLATPGYPDARFYWTRIMPFMDPVRGAFDFELYGWDVRELRFLRRWMRPGAAFVDIGAHHGLYSVLAAQLAGPQGRVAAFEPSPPVFRRLRWHLRLNGALGVETHSCALGRERGRATLYIPTHGIDTVSSLRPGGVSSGHRQVAVEVLPLDESPPAQWPAIDLIKLDAEGAEIEILQGARQTIARRRPLWLFEALDATSAGWGSSGRELVERFLSLDCRLFEFTPEGRLRPHPPRTAYPLDSNCNLLAVPAEKTDRLTPLLAG